MCHKCDNPLCINPDHLFIGTEKDNSTDMIRKGRAAKHIGLNGSKNVMAKLNEEDVVKIRKMLAKGRRATDIAREFGMGSQAIYYIKWGTNWKSVGGAT